uniref:C2H2-type domain-containing protein n=1 Tax=Clytia hemisphaerica TaxID=252671 RepID=A0A7M5V6Q1_9CNID
MLEDIQLLNSKKHAIKESNQKRSLRQQFRWKSLECNVCGQRFSENKVLAKHMMQHQNAIPKCPIGEKTIFDRVSNMDKDFEKHDNNILPTIVDRNGGKKILEDAQSTETAMIIVRDGANISSKDNLCQFCGKKFSRNASLKLHKRTVHEGVRDFMCKVCGKEFSNRRGMLNHERVIHRGIKAFECEICGIRFGLKSNLTRHIKIHQGTESFSCE